jgi:hypothetical protein
VAVRKVTVVLVLQAATQQNSIFFQSKMSKWQLHVHYGPFKCYHSTVGFAIL